MIGRSLQLALLTLALATPATALAQSCPSAPTFDPAIPTWESVNSYPLGSQEATNEQLTAYVNAIDRASTRVRTGVLATTVQGRPLQYALVSDPATLEPHRFEALTAEMRALRDARRTHAQAMAIAAHEPAIVWIAASVHSNEPSGADADMRLLYEMAARTDCANLERLRSLLTVLLPVQNPDGRAAGTRTNAYNFDLNRDWFARTQPETDGKLRMLDRLPPVLLADQHEQTGTAFFFPPNADPIHHEITAQSLHAIDDIVSPAIRQAFDRRGIDYTNYTTYDLFFMGYGDTVPTTLFGAGGMTFEKGGQSPYNEKTDEHFLAADTTLTAATKHKDELLRGWASEWIEAKAQGARGLLEPNLVVQPGNTVRFQVPSVSVYAYVLRADRHAADAAALVQRLRTMGVEAYRLRRPLRTRALHDYGVAGVHRAKLPKGTYFIPMRQAQKHWVQALLGEDAYVPFPYFYDVSGWSNPLLMGLDGGALEARIARRVLHPRRRAALLAPVAVGPAPVRAPARAAAYGFETGSEGALDLVFALMRAGVPVARRPQDGVVVVGGSQHLDALARLAAAHRAPLLRFDQASVGTRPLRAPKVALLTDLVETAGQVPGAGTAAALALSAGWTRFVLERRFGLAVDILNDADLAAGRLQSGGYTTFVVSDGSVPQGGLEPVALQRLQDWVHGGGTFIGERGQGIAVAQAAGISSAQTQAPPADFEVPGVSLRVDLDPADPVAWGEAHESFVFNTGDPIIAPGSGGHIVARYPADSRFFVSGYATGTDSLKGTPAVVHEKAGAGDVVLFAVDANFRAYVESTQRLFANALLMPPASSAARATARRRSRARPIDPSRLAVLPSPFRDTVVRVALGSEPALRAALATAGAPAGARIARDLTSVTLRVPNPSGEDRAAAAWPQRLLAALAARRVRPLYVAL